MKIKYDLLSVSVKSLYYTPLPRKVLKEWLHRNWLPTGKMVKLTNRKCRCAKKIVRRLRFTLGARGFFVPKKGPLGRQGASVYIFP